MMHVPVNPFKLVPVMKAHVQCGLNGQFGMLVLLNVMVVLEQESEDVSMEQQVNQMVARVHPKMKSSVICNPVHVKWFIGLV